MRVLFITTRDVRYALLSNITYRGDSLKSRPMMGEAIDETTIASYLITIN